MVKRTCPDCGTEIFSANDKGVWVCKCGCVLDEELNETPNT